jgi:hypothetical protein
MFTVESWAAHLRQHARVSATDKILQDKIFALHRGAIPPRVTHAVTPHAVTPHAGTNPSKNDSPNPL